MRSNKKEKESSPLPAPTLGEQLLRGCDRFLAECGIGREFYNTPAGRLFRELFLVASGLPLRKLLKAWQRDAGVMGIRIRPEILAAMKPLAEKCEEVAA